MKIFGIILLTGIARTVFEIEDREKLQWILFCISIDQYLELSLTKINIF